jgi:hypothetical protein
MVIASSFDSAYISVLWPTNIERAADHVTNICECVVLTVNEKREEM